MSGIIKSITGIKFEITPESEYDLAVQNNCSTALIAWKTRHIKRIELEGNRYTGYNFHNEQVFSYLANSVNVHYLNESPPEPPKSREFNLGNCKNNNSWSL